MERAASRKSPRGRWLAVHLGGGLHRYGLRTQKAFLRAPPQTKEFLPQNPNPEKLDYAAARQMVQTFVDDVIRAEATLAEVTQLGVPRVSTTAT